MPPAQYGPLWAYLRDNDLNPPGRAEQKKFISFRAQRNLSVSPNYVTKGLKHFVRGERLIPSTFRIGTQFPTAVFSIGKPDESLRLCEQRANQRAELMDFTVMGSIFEEVVRKVIGAARRAGCNHFARIPQSGHLGFQFAGESSGDRIDLPVRYKSGRREYPLAFEAKNESDPTHITDAVFRNGKRRSKFEKLIRMALQAQAQPVFVAAYVTQRTREQCARIGIPVYQFGRQFLPFEWHVSVTV
jgi:hypothetical protein